MLEASLGMAQGVQPCTRHQGMLVGSRVGLLLFDGQSK